MKQDFDDTHQRKKFKEGINRTFKSLKRSEKQVVQKNIDQILFGDPDEDIAPDMFENLFD
jgi:hypothetical protein